MDHDRSEPRRTSSRMPCRPDGSKGTSLTEEICCYARSCL
ncbi:hypothetical protein GBAR_LOCUS28360 [Geodia barretti]|uniref:Uncharacterized protein n=1 Tax=Geodia barretti TaxID=519541 RepID=A0AA35TQE4_GEOBA|nr:hypothetical protein GBAR_LOCUS28360 [Geodia barretti]